MARRKQKDWVLFNATMWMEDKDLRACTLATRGFWLECLCWMWASNENFLEGAKDGLARLTACLEPGEFDRYLADLKKNNVARITRRKDIIKIEGGKWVSQGRSRYISPKIKAKVKARGSCRYCGATENLTVDHIEAFANGGTHDPRNLQCACQSCNSKKRTLSHREFLRKLRRVDG